MNPFALVRAACQWARYGRVISGGSTITMQVARIVDPTPRTLLGKLHQILRAFQLELHYSKREILTLYLNYAPMGGVLEGVEAASRAYLGKPATRLTHAEAAMLAVLPQAPSLLRPDRYPQRAGLARDKVLRRMTDRWSPAQIQDALTETVYAQTIREPMLAPLLAERLKRSSHGKLRIDTTIDARQMQESVETLLLDRARSLPPHVSSAALVVDNATMEVRAYAGSADFADLERFNYVDMVRAWRSPGSTLKPFLYGFAIDAGLIHSESLLADVPQSFDGYQPGNFEQTFHGAVSASEALVRSLNVPAVEVLNQFGADRFVGKLRQGGLKLRFARGAEPNLSVILGGADVYTGKPGGFLRPAAFARGGMAGHTTSHTRRATRRPPDDECGRGFHRARYSRDRWPGRPRRRGSRCEPGHRLEDPRHQLWLSRRLGGRRQRSLHDRRMAWAARTARPIPGYFGANISTPLLMDLFAALSDSSNAPPALAHTPPPSVTQARICWPLGTQAGAQPADLSPIERTAWLLDGTAPPTFPDPIPGAANRCCITASIA